MESILTSIKKLLGPEAEYEHFDPEIIMHINSVFTILRRMGVGPSTAFRIEDETSVWTDFVTDIEEIELVKSYVYLKVKLLFDPPLNSAHLNSIKEQIQEFEWRLNEIADTSNTES